MVESCEYSDAHATFYTKKIHCYEQKIQLGNAVSVMFIHGLPLPLNMIYISYLISSQYDHLKIFWYMKSESYHSSSPYIFLSFLIQHYINTSCFSGKLIFTNFVVAEWRRCRPLLLLPWVMVGPRELPLFTQMPLQRSTHSDVDKRRNLAPRDSFPR